MTERTPEETTKWLDEVEARCEAATPAPWEACPRHVHNTGDQDEMSGLGWEVDGPPEPMLRGQFSKAGDAIFIAHARTDVPELIDWARRAVAAEARVKELEAQLADRDRPHMSTTILSCQSKSGGHTYLWAGGLVPPDDWHCICGRQTWGERPKQNGPAG